MSIDILFRNKEVNPSPNICPRYCTWSLLVSPLGTDPGHPLSFLLDPTGRLMIHVLITIPKEVYTEGWWGLRSGPAPGSDWNGGICLCCLTFIFHTVSQEGNFFCSVFVWLGSHSWTSTPLETSPTFFLRK